MGGVIGGLFGGGGGSAPPPPPPQQAINPFQGLARISEAPEPSDKPEAPDQADRARAALGARRRKEGLFGSGQSDRSLLG